MLYIVYIIITFSLSSSQGAKSVFDNCHFVTVTGEAKRFTQKVNIYAWTIPCECIRERK